jgi:hypothetical protein
VFRQFQNHWFWPRVCAVKLVHDPTGLGRMPVDTKDTYDHKTSKVEMTNPVVPRAPRDSASEEAHVAKPM